MRILNLTQHNASKEQAAEEPKNKQDIIKLLNFAEVPHPTEITQRANELAEIAKKENAENALIGGAPFLMPELEKALRAKGITPYYAFSKRDSIETTTPDGKVIKKSVFKHVAYIKGMAFKGGAKS